LSTSVERDAGEAVERLSVDERVQTAIIAAFKSNKTHTRHVSEYDVVARH